MKTIVKAKLLHTYFTSEGTLYKDSIVRIESIDELIAKVRDELGKIYYIHYRDLLLL
jgi:hypothetical protein